MKKKKDLERLIRSLIEAVNDTIRNSSEIRTLMKEIEEHGYEIHLSLLAGIVLRDLDEDTPEDLSSIFGEHPGFDPHELGFFDELQDQEVDLIAGILDGEIFTDEDRRFLTSLGLSTD